MDKLAKLEGALMEHLLAGDVEKFINELRMLNINEAELRSMDPFGDNELGLQLAKIMNDLTSGHNYTEDVNKLQAMLKTSNKMFSSIGLGEPLNVHDVNSIDTSYTGFVSPIGRDNINTVSNRGTEYMSTVDVNNKEFSVGDTVIDTNKSDGIHQIVGTTEEGNPVLDNGSEIKSKDAIKRVHLGAVMTGSSIPSTQGNGGETIDAGVDFSNPIDKFLDWRLKRADKSLAYHTAITNKAMQLADAKQKLKYAKMNPLQRARYNSRKIGSTMDTINTVIGGASNIIGNTADALGNVNKLVSSGVNTINSVNGAINDNPVTPEQVRNSIGDQPTPESIRNYIAAQQAARQYTASEHLMFSALTDMATSYIDAVDNDEYVRIFSAPELMYGDIIELNYDDTPIEVMVTDSLVQDDGSITLHSLVLDDSGLELGDTLMFSTDSDELYMSTDFYDPESCILYSDTLTNVAPSVAPETSTPVKWVVITNRDTHSVDIQGPMSIDEAESILAQSASADNTVVQLASDEEEAQRLVYQNKDTFRHGLLENAGLFIRDESPNVMPAIAVKPNSVTTVTTANGPEEVIVNHSEAFDDDSVMFSVTVLDSSDFDAIGTDYVFNVPNETMFSVHDMYIEDADCYYSDLSDEDYYTEDYID